ncbi:MAG: SpoIIE family protein phosphatase [Candidatus Riflebacteria bacterium]|nr:SpoIIE family protein phosphatase [Candidatus Riflebacteria bacterium]
MNKMHSLLQGNSHGIKAVYSTGVNLKNLKIAPFANQLEFRELFSKQTYFPQPSAEFVEIAGRKWIASGFVSKVIADTTLIALSPTEEIQRRLSLEKRQLLGIMLINVLLVAGITLIFVQTILKPVYQLQNATDAIRSRNFSFRIPELGKDEFGKMSRIFNSALGDLQEMSLARDVQQQLFPKQQIETGQYDLFSKTLTMADLGGDYLDVFPLDSDRFIMVLGDVAGHGVGAAMIMAMAKSAMLNSIEILDRPTELLNRLHALIYRTKSKKQKKIMTFQYVMVDTREHKITFANAGGCSPYLVRSKDKTVEEIMLPGAALGSFKNARFNQLEIILEPGDTLVLYTDGLVESRNDHDEELGYQNFKSMLLENHCVGSQQYFDRIMLANQIWRQSQPPQDDFSLMILGRRPC